MLNINVKKQYNYNNQNGIFRLDLTEKLEKLEESIFKTTYAATWLNKLKLECVFYFAYIPLPFMLLYLELPH